MQIGWTPYLKWKKRRGPNDTSNVWVFTLFPMAYAYAIRRGILSIRVIQQALQYF